MKSVVNALIVAENAILLVKRSPDSDEPNMWSLPGWTVENGEESIEALRRELSEELGLQEYWIIEFFQKIDFSPEVSAFYFFLHLEKKPQLTLALDELTEYQFVEIGTNLESMAFAQEKILAAANVVLLSRSK